MRRDAPPPVGLPALTRGALAQQQVRNGVALRIAQDEQVIDLAALDYSGNNGSAVRINSTEDGLELAPPSDLIEWGDIGGALSAQSDLQAALNAKLDDSQAGAYGLSWLATTTVAAAKALLALVKGDVGLGNVDNTSDANKPVSTAQQTALDLKLDDSQIGTSGTKIPLLSTANTFSAQQIINGGFGSIPLVLDSGGLGKVQFKDAGAVTGAIFSDATYAIRFGNAIGDIKATLSQTGDFAVTGAVTGSNLSGTNTGDQTSIVSITGTKAQFNTAVTDGDFVFTSDLGTSVATFLATPSSANLRAALTDETGTGAAVFANAPTLNAGVLAGTTDVSGGQLKFPATAVPSVDANTLDDYEEGTFTPGLTFGGGSTGMTFNVANTSGSYTKTGRVVICRLRIILTAKGSSTGNASITGLPFTSIAGFPTAAFLMPLNMATLNAPVALVGAGATTVGLFNFNGTTSVAMTDANFTNTSIIYITVLYDA